MLTKAHNAEFSGWPKWRPGSRAAQRKHQAERFAEVPLVQEGAETTATVHSPIQGVTVSVCLTPTGISIGPTAAVSQESLWSWHHDMGKTRFCHDLSLRIILIFVKYSVCQMLHDVRN